jgi:hypothetical protein
MLSPWEELFVKVMNGEPIIDEDDNNGKCSRVVSARTGVKGRSQCRVFILCFPALNLKLTSAIKRSTITRMACRTLPKSSL